LKEQYNALREKKVTYRTKALWLTKFACSIIAAKAPEGTK